MGCTPSVTCSVFVAPCRLTVTLTVSPDLDLNTAAVRSSADLMAVPSKPVTTSPTFSPAFAAGEPLTIVVI